MKEQNYFKLIFATAILLLLCTIASFVLLVVYFSKGLETPGNNVFELMYMSFHFLVVALIAVFSLRAIKGGESLILTTLMYDQHHQRSKPARIIALVFAGLGFVFFTPAVFVVFAVLADLTALFSGFDTVFGFAVFFTVLTVSLTFLS